MLNDSGREAVIGLCLPTVSKAELGDLQKASNRLIIHPIFFLVSLLTDFNQSSLSIGFENKYP
ncbi:hypothetical protein NBRC116595_10340 [Aliiglaciecola sp. NS0011-25]